MTGVSFLRRCAWIKGSELASRRAGFGKLASERRDEILLILRHENNEESLQIVFRLCCRIGFVSKKLVTNG
jgi:hypothetical protein